MIRLYDGKQVIDLEMSEAGVEMDEVGFFADGKLSTCHDFLGYESPVYAVDDVDYCIDYATDWADCAGDFYDDFEEYADKREVTVYRLAHVLIVGGSDDGAVAFVGSLDRAREYAKEAESRLSEDKQGLVFYQVFDEQGEEE